MTEETLLFQSDIVADIDIKPAKAKLESLQREIGKVESSVHVALSSIQNLVGRVDSAVNGVITAVSGVTSQLDTIDRELYNHQRALESVREEQDELSESAANQIEAYKRAFDQYQRTVDNLEDANRQQRNTIETLQQKVASLKEVGAQAQRTADVQVEAEQAVQHEMGKTLTVTQDLESRIASLASSLGGRIRGAPGMEGSASFGTWKGKKVAKQALASMITAFRSQYKELEITNEEIYDAILRVMSKSAALIGAENNKATEAVKKAWQQLADELVNFSIVTDMMDAMEHQLVERMEKILGSHVQLLDSIMFMGTKKSADEVVKVYSQAIRAIEQEQDKLRRGVIADKRTTEQIITDMIEPMIMGMDDYLRRYRELQGWSKFMSLENVAKRIAKDGKSILTVMQEVDAANKKAGISFRDVSMAIKQDLSQSLVDSATQIKLFAGRMQAGILDALKGTVSGLKRTPGLVRTLVGRGLKAAFNALPLDLAATIGDSSRRMIAALSNATQQPIRDTLGEIKNAFKPINDYLADIGKQAGNNLIFAIKSSIDAGVEEVKTSGVALAKKTGDAMLDQFKFTLGGLFDVITGKSKKERVAGALRRSEELGMTKTFERARKEANYYGVAIEDAANTTEHQMRVIRQSFMDTAKNVVMALDTMLKGQISFKQGIKGVGIAFDQMADVGARNVGLTQSMSAVQSHLARTLGVSTVALSGYRRENELLDRGLQRIATSVDLTANEMKEQGQVMIKIHEQRRQQFQAQMVALGKWVAAYKKVVEVEDQGAKSTADARERAGQALVKATAELEKLGIAQEVFKGNAESIQDLAKRVEQFGTAVDIGLSQKFKSVFDNSKAMVGGLENELEKMSTNFPKALSMWNRAIQDVEQNSKHFLTTLRDGGKISTERLQDLLLAYQDLARASAKAQRLGLLRDPKMAQLWENLQRNSLLAIRNFTLMAQRARTVEAVKEKLFGTTKKLTNSIVSLGSAAAKHIPIIGKKARVSAEQMDTFRAATDRAMSSSSGVTLALQGLDPVIGDIADGISSAGMQFSDTMNSMAEVAKVKTGSIIKSFTALKIAALGIIGLFSGLIISTGKLAAEVTTLNITMKTVATNLGVPISYAEHLVEVLKETGITTKEATIALTQWMRAGLAFEWEDPIQKAAYSMEDLARAAQQMAVAMGENSSEMYGRFIDFIQTGNSQLLKAAGIMKTANQMYKEYAKAIGKSVEALSIREKQEALISGIMRESTKLQGVYTEAMKSASKQLGSMKRYIEELRLEWGKHFEPILATIIFRFNQLLKYLRDIPESTKKTITTFITIATAVSGLVLGLTFLIPKLKVAFTLFKAFSGLLLGKFGLLLTLITAVAGLFARWFMNIKVESDGVQGLVDRVDKILESFGGLKQVLLPVQRWLSSFFDMIRYHAIRIKYLVEKIIERFGEWVENFKRDNPELINLLERTRKVFGDLFTMIWKVVDLLLSSIEALLKGDWEDFFNKIKMIGRYILSWFLEFFFEVVVSAYEWGKNIISAFGKGLMDKAKSIIPQIMTAIGNLIGAFLEGHSPAKMGPLSNIDIWGEGIMDTFLKSMSGKRFRFDEDMFEGIGSLGAKAKLWGDNIIDVFMYGITGKAAQAVGPAMGYVGGLIARFLEGHSPPEVGPLTEIMDWGRNAFEVFLAGFEMADFSFLDRALDLVRRRLQLVVEDSAEAGKKIAQAMLAAREYIAGAVSTARATGGPLDLGGMSELILGPLKIMAKDVGAVLEATFEAMKAEAEIKYLEEQIENVIKARTEAAGLIFDENLMKELQLQLESASREVDRAQRRLSNVQREAGRYGVNVLTWEEINAQAQVDLAERRREEIENQIDGQEQIQNEIERIRNEVEGQYAAELEAAEANYAAAQERAEYLSALLEQRLAWEEELKKANEQINNAVSGGKEITEEIAEGFENMYEGLTDIASAMSGWEFEVPKVGPPTFSELWEKYFGEVFTADLFGDIKHIGLGGFIKAKIEEIWDKFVATPIGQWLKGSGQIAAIEEWITQIGDFLERFKDLFALFKTGEKIKVLGFELPSLQEIWRWISWFGEQTAGILGNLFSMLIPDLLTGLLGGGWDNFMTDLEEFTDIIIGWFPSIQMTGEEVWDYVGQIFDSIGGLVDTFKASWEEAKQEFAEIVEWIKALPGEISTFFGELPGKIVEAINGVVEAILSPFISAHDQLIGNSIIPDLINGIIAWIAGLPAKILEFAGQILTAAITIGQQIYTGIWTKVEEIILNIAGWFGTIAETILTTAETIWNAAWEVGRQIYAAIYDIIFNEETGIIAKIGGWLQSIADVVAAAWEGFYNAAYSVGESIIGGITDAINKLKSGLTGIVKGIWNDGLRVGFNKVLSGVASAVNKVVDILNSAWTAMGSPSWVPGFPISHVGAPQLPKLQAGGVIVGDTLAQLHAGEVVLPLDRLESVMRSLNLLPQQMPVFAPEMHFYAGAEPQQVVPAVNYAYTLYEERVRSGV